MGGRTLQARPRQSPRTAEAVSLRPTGAQFAWLRRGLDQPGGKLPLFDRDGKRVSDRTVKSCIRQGWAKPWFDNPIKPDWLVCKLTDEGRAVAAWSVAATRPTQRSCRAAPFERTQVWRCRRAG